MEALIEGLIEIFGEIIINIIAAIIGAFFDYLNENSKVKRIVKSTVAFVFYGAAIVLFIFSFMYQKKILLSLTIGYFIIATTLYLLKFTNKNKWVSKKANKVIKIIQHILHYVFPVALIVVGAITLVDINAKIWLIVASSLAILIRLSIDIYKADRGAVKKNIYYQENTNPLTYHMVVDLDTYNLIKKEKSAPIICINSFEKQKINIGDYIVVSNDYNKGEIKTKVVNKEEFKTVEKLYKKKRFEIPFKTINEINTYLASNYYSNIDIEKNGLLYFLVYFETND